MSEETILVIALAVMVVIVLLASAAVLLTASQFAQLRQMIEELVAALLKHTEDTNKP